MKYIHTFWTKPFSDKCQTLCGHISKDNIPYFIANKVILCKYSFNLLKKISSDIELVTDELGAKLLKFLPYSKIRKDLENLDNISTELWGAPQIIGLSLYDEPVCSIDYDFLIKDHVKFKKIIDSEYDVIVQSKEVSPSFNLNYDYAIRNFISILGKEFLNDYPEFLYFDSYNFTYNCGFYGFKNVELMKDFIGKSIKLHELLTEKKLIQQYYECSNLFTQRHDYLSTLNVNCILSQFFLTLWSNYNNIFVKEICPMKEWQKFNIMNQKMNNYQNETPLYTHYAALDKDLFFTEEVKEKFDNIINNK